MAPQIATAKLTLSCPLYAADFDSRNHGFLIVGGGGGEGRSGIANKIVGFVAHNLVAYLILIIYPSVVPY